MGTGLVRDAVLDLLVTDPLRVVFFDGASARAPALVIGSEPASAKAAVAALSTALQRGGFTVDGCPGEKADEKADEKPDEKPDASPPPDAPEPDLSADGVADGSSLRTRSSTSCGGSWPSKSSTWPRRAGASSCHARRSPPSTARAQRCPRSIPVPGADLQVSPLLEKLGRPTQVLAQMLGVEDTVRFAWKAEGTRLVPVGSRRTSRTRSASPMRRSPSRS